MFWNYASERFLNDIQVWKAENVIDVLKENFSEGLSRTKVFEVARRGIRLVPLPTVVVSKYLVCTLKQNANSSLK